MFHQCVEYHLLTLRCVHLTATPSQDII
jgi:hypothetical protein